jgi:hypothetical protein
MMYFKSGAGIENPVDVDGNLIKEGDILTHCWFEEDYVAFFKKHLNITDIVEIERRVHLPNVIVKFNNEKKFYYGVGVDVKSAYMHDFRFKYTKIIKK